MNKKGLSLAINQVVILIISIVILSFGTVFLFNIMGEAEHTLNPVDDKLRKKMSEALSRGDVVEMPISTQQVKADELAKFNLGILNDPAMTDQNEFHVIINHTKTITRGGDSYTDDFSDSLLLTPEVFPDGNPTTTVNIEENENEILRIGVHPKKSDNYKGPGQYFFQLCVCEGDSCDGATTCKSSTISGMDNLYGHVAFSVITR